MSYLHHGDSGVNLGRQGNMDLILVSVNTRWAEEILIYQIVHQIVNIDTGDDIMMISDTK